MLNDIILSTVVCFLSFRNASAQFRVMQLGRHSGVITLVFVVILCANIVLFLYYYADSFAPLLIMSSQDFCLSLILTHLNMSDLINPNKTKKPRRRSPILALSIPPYPLTRVPTLCRKLLEPLYLNQASQTKKELACFLKNHYNSKAKTLIRSNLLRLVQAFERNKIDLILDSGSLLGSWRHHGIIPYDDDVDFHIRWEDKPRVRSLLIDLCARHGDCAFRDTEETIQHWKLDIGCQRQGTGVTACFMQIDFFFFWIVGGQVKIFEPPYSYPISVFFPLIERPFEGVLVKSVRDFARYYQLTYKSSNLTECRSYKLDKMQTSRCNTLKINCSVLEPFHPFVRTFTDHAEGRLEVQIYKREIVEVFYDPRT